MHFKRRSVVLHVQARRLQIGYGTAHQQLVVRVLVDANFVVAGVEQIEVFVGRQ